MYLYARTAFSVERAPNIYCSNPERKVKHINMLIWIYLQSSRPETVKFFVEEGKCTQRNNIYKSRVTYILLFLSYDKSEPLPKRVLRCYIQPSV